LPNNTEPKIKGDLAVSKPKEIKCFGWCEKSCQSVKTIAGLGKHGDSEQDRLVSTVHRRVNWTFSGV